MNERIKELRKSLGLTQQEFASRLKIGRNNIAGYETGKRGLSDAVFSLICKTFHVNEEWLRSGIGDMFVQPDTFSLDQYAKDHGCTELELEILKAYFELDPSIRETVVNHFQDRLTFSRQPLPPSPDLADLAARVDALEKEEGMGSYPPVPAKSISRSR